MAGGQEELKTLTITLTLTMAGARNFREYSVWKEAVSFATCVYEVTGKLPWLTALILVATRQCSSELGIVLAAPRIREEGPLRPIAKSCCIH